MDTIANSCLALHANARVSMSRGVSISSGQVASDCVSTNTLKNHNRMCLGTKAISECLGKKTECGYSMSSSGVTTNTF